MFHKQKNLHHEIKRNQTQSSYKKLIFQAYQQHWLSFVFSLCNKIFLDAVTNVQDQDQLQHCSFWAVFLRNIFKISKIGKHSREQVDDHFAAHKTSTITNRINIKIAIKSIVCRLYKQCWDTNRNIKSWCTADIESEV